MNAYGRSDEDCWLRPTTRPGGYAIFGSRKEWCHGELYVHRIAWRAAHDGREIPEGYEIDHLCFVRNCFNPAHLECITLLENRQRRRPRVYVKIVHDITRPPEGQCKHGHDWAVHAKLTTQGRWACLECGRDAVRRHDAKRRPKVRT
jgi:hypothetical protein